LVNLIKPFCPTYLSIGGTKSDSIQYLNSEKGNLNNEMWDKLHTFLNKTNCKLVFTLNAAKWDSLNTKELLEYSKANDYDINDFRFGNEINAFWLKGLDTNNYYSNFNNRLRIYSHSTSKLYPNYKEGSVSFLLINLDEKDSVEVLNFDDYESVFRNIRVNIEYAYEIKPQSYVFIVFPDPSDIIRS
jgi:hypothetical protein